MEFIDFSTFSSDETSTNELPEPAAPLILPSANSDLTSKFKRLSLLRKNFTSNEASIPTEKQPESDDINITSKTAEKYASLSMSFFDRSGQSDLATDDFTAELHSNSSASKGSVLSAKLTKILNDYDDSSIYVDSSLRDALNILKKQKEGANFKDLIRSDLLGSIARRNFRSSIENDLLKQHSIILKEFQPVVTKIEVLGDKINQISDISVKLQTFKSLDPELLQQIEEYSNSEQSLTLQKSLLLNFKKKFTLNQYEEHYLQNENISLEFFEILSKCERIHSNCSVLLSLKNPNLGLKIMDKMKKFIELGQQRISFFLETQFMKNNQEFEYEQINMKDLKLLKNSIFYLTRNLTLFDSVINKLIQSRSKFLVDEFLFQLNNGGSLDNSRPLIMSAHDPLRYIGDILAYVHSVIVNEVEFIGNLFDINSNDENLTEFEQSLIQEENFKNISETVDNIIDKIMTSFTRPLKIRIEQIIRSETKLDIIYKIFQLLELYKMMYRKFFKIESKCSLFENLSSLQQISVERIFTVINDDLKLIQSSNEREDWKLTDNLLLPPDWLRDFLNETLILFKELETGSGDDQFMTLTEEEFDELLVLIVNKPLEFIDKQASLNFTKKQLRDSLTYKLNSLDFIENKLIVLPIMGSKVQNISELIREYRDKLTDIQFNLLLENTNLSIHQQLIELIFPISQIENEDDYMMYTSLLENKLFHKPKIIEIEEQLQKFLPVALIEVQQSLFKITSATIANDIIINSSIKFLELYTVFYRILKELYPEDEFLQWNTLDVATLLGIENVYKEELQRLL